MPLTITLVSAESGEITNVQVLSSDNIRALQHKAYNDLQVPPPFQDLRHNGTTLDLNLTISASGLSDGDLIMVHRTQPTTMQTQNFGHSETALLASLRANPSLMSALHAANPSLHARVTTGDASALPHVAALLHAQSQQQSFQDPMSSDAQRAIEERIREENVMQNMEAAIEHNPESFGKVVMLFVDCKINSVPGVKAFVDRYFSSISFILPPSLNRRYLKLSNFISSLSI